MKSKILQKQTFFLASTGGTAFLLTIIIFFALSLPVQATSVELKSYPINQSTTAKKQTDPGLPIRLKIPKINIYTTIEYIGLTSQGAMGIPKSRSNVVWFNLGPNPGDIGSAVIAGHYGRWKDGVVGVFNDLSKLRIGDKIYIKNKNGVTITFIVRKSQNYQPNADATDIFTSNDNKSHLNLITCGGDWNKKTQNYSKRLVIFTDKE